MDIITTNSYSEYKQMLDKELKTNVESFVRIGYLLKIARDTNVLAESGYTNVAEFAKAEYGLTKDIVSRYIAINDRYSEGGYSDRLQLQFENYGVAKLSEMLTLPDDIIAEIEPTLTRKEIQDVKKEIAEEEKISPLEVMAEAAAEENVRDEESFTIRQRIWKAHFYENKEDFIKISKFIGAFIPFPDKLIIEKLVDVLAPTGCQVRWARIPGVGKIMISVKGRDIPITFTNIRDGSKLECSAEDIYHDLGEIYGEMTKRAWEKLYGEPFEAVKEEEKPEVAPVQQTEPAEVPKVQNTDNIAKAPAEPSPWKDNEMNQPEADITESAREIEAEVIEHKEEVPEAAAEEQLPGQMNIDDYEEEIPKVEGEIVQETQEEYEIVEDMLECIQVARRTLADHVGENDPKLADWEISALQTNAEYLMEMLNKIKAGRK